MDFYEVLDQIIDLLRQRGRVSYQALKRQFDVDDAYLEDLKVELMEVQELAADRDGKMLVWSGEAARTPEPTPAPATQELVSPSITVHRRAIDCLGQTVASLDGARRRERFGDFVLPAVFSRAQPHRLVPCRAGHVCRGESPWGRRGGSGLRRRH